MSEAKRNDVCIWVVRSESGQVKKVRLSWLSILAIFIVGVFVSGTMLFVLSDYARVQILRAKNYFMLKEVSSERDNLRASHKDLETQVESLINVNEHARNYEQNVKARLNELAAIINASTELGLVGAPSLANKRGGGSDAEGVGGAEVECSGGEMCDLPSTDNSGDDSDKRASMGAISAKGLKQDVAYNPSLRDGTEEDLVETLDSYIDFLRFLPFGIPASGHVSSEFGYRRSPFSRKLSMHEGIDLSLSLGSMVVATADGVIHNVKRGSTYGLMIDIAHTSKVVTRYAHLSKAFVNPGEKVCRGEVIGLAGSTGRSTGPHLHYEVRINNKPRNPNRYMELGPRLARLLSVT